MSRPRSRAAVVSDRMTELLSEYRREVFDRSQDIDPYDDYHWTSLALGWALAKGLDAEKAQEFARLAP
jgi:hypothetical protein